MSATHEQASARVAALFPSRWLRGYVGSKLRRDVVFPAVYELLRTCDQPILDVGCGVGLLAFYLRERGVTVPIIGIDIDNRKVRQARRAAEGRYEALEFREGDVADGVPEFSGTIVMLDLLHYLSPTAQEKLLTALAARVAPGGLLLLRDSPRESSPRFWMTCAAERFAQAVAWNWNTQLHFATAEFIHSAFPPAEFTREERPASGTTPFNNRLFIFERHSSAAVPDEEGRSGNHERSPAGA